MENKINQNQEIDLLELFSRMGKGIKNVFLGLFRAIVFLIIFGVKHIHYLLLFAIAGGAIGWLIYSNTPRFYSSNLIAQPNGISATDMIQYINDLHKLCERKNIAALANDLQMQDTTAKKIKDIQAFFIIDANKDGIGDYVDYKNTYNPKDTTQQRLEDRIHVSVEVFDNTAFDNVRNGLFRYMRKNPYIIQLNEIRKDELKELIAQTDKEILKLDSLQNTEYFSGRARTPVRESQLMFLAQQEPQMYYKDIMTLVRQKQHYKKELELATDAFTVIKDFTSLAVAENPRNRYIIIYGLITFIAGYFFLLFYIYSKQILVLMNQN